MIKLGVVLSGGIAKGAYQVGFCMALENHSAFSVEAISSASIGTLNGYAFAVGKLSEARQLWKSIDYSSYRQAYNGLFKSKDIFKLIDNLCSKDDELRFPLYTVCCSQSFLKPRYIGIDSVTSEERPELLKASISIPAIMSGITIDNQKYWDGAILDNVPVVPLLKKKLDLIIVIQFDGNKDLLKDKRLVCPTLFLNPHSKSGLMDSFSLNSSSVDNMITEGFRIGDDILTLLERSYNDYPRFLNFIDSHNRTLDKSSINGDYIVRKINRLSRLQ